MKRLWPRNKTKRANTTVYLMPSDNGLARKLACAEGVRCMQEMSTPVKLERHPARQET